MQTGMTIRPVILVLFLCACGASVDSIARQASKAAVGEGAEALTEEKTQHSLAEASKDPELQAATTRMTDQIAEGILKALSTEQAKGQIGVLTKQITENAVKELMAELGSQETKARLAGLTSLMASAAMQQVANSLQTDLRPAVRAMIQDDIGPGIASALGAQLQPVLGQTAQTVAYNAVVGANRSLGDALQRDEGLAARVDDGARAGLGFLWLPLSVLGLLTVMAMSLAVVMVARARRTRAEVDRLESATLLLATAMRERRETAETDEIVAVVQQALEGRAEKSGKHRIIGALGLRKSG